MTNRRGGLPLLILLELWDGLAQKVGVEWFGGIYMSSTT